MLHNDTWKSISTLSELDTKDLTGCVLKVMEEAGELALEAQSFASLDGSHHRVATQKNILEECIDGTLANLSIACKLGFSKEEVEEMLSAKLRKWSNLQRAQAVMQEKLPFEIHVTVKEADAERFKQACAVLEVKPIILALQAGDDVIRDVMTSSVCMGDNQAAIQEMTRIKQGLQFFGFEVVREKIESVPWHPAAPSEANEQYDMPKDCYFESHIAVVIDSNTTREAIQSFCNQNDLHLSRNAMKRYEDGSYRLMLTLRAYKGTREAFESRLNGLVDTLRTYQNAQGEPLPIDKVITEFSLYDSRVSHDLSWLTANKK